MRGTRKSTAKPCWARLRRWFPSGARQFKVELLEKSDQIHLLVHDSGKGFDAKMVNGTGLGLISMRERVKLVKGELSIESQHAQGTTIHASVPFAAKGTA